MSRKNKNDVHGFVYSTDPEFRFGEKEQQPLETLPLQQQKLKVLLQTKQRGGKTVTVVSGFRGKEEDLERLGKNLKNFCGTGGAVKEGEVLIQGDQREKVLQWLIKKGYTNSKKI